MLYIQRGNVSLERMIIWYEFKALLCECTQWKFAIQSSGLIAGSQTAPRINHLMWGRNHFYLKKVSWFPHLGSQSNNKLPLISLLVLLISLIYIFQQTETVCWRIVPKESDTNCTSSPIANNHLREAFSISSVFQLGPCI